MDLVPANKVQTLDDSLARYATTVHGLHEKLRHIAAGKKEVAENLGRAAAALRSIAAISSHRKKTNSIVPPGTQVTSR